MTDRERSSGRPFSQRAIAPFGSVDQRIFLGSSDLRFQRLRWDEKFERTGAFYPSQDEYLSGLVHRPRIADQVLTRLLTEGWVTVLGRGASGKTVLGKLISLESELSIETAHYLDLANHRERNLVTEDIFLKQNSPGRSLYILDNIHLNEDLTYELWRAWFESARDFSHLLLLGRELRVREGMRFDSSSAHVLILRARQPEVIGVYDRLSRRWQSLRSINAPVRPPPPEAVRGWIEVFGGGDPESADTTVDLMALSAAMWRRMGDILQNQWTLRESDARTEVQEEYIRKANKPERANLARLASMPDDFQIPRDILHDPIEGFPSSLSRGLVFETEYGRRKRASFHFAHAALGRLILDAVGSQSAANELRAVAREDPYTAVAASEQFMRDRRPEFAKQILLSVLDQPDWLVRYHGTLGHLGTALNSLQALGGVSSQALAQSLESQWPTLTDIGRRSSLDSWLRFLTIAETSQLYRVASALLTDIDADNKTAFSERPMELLVGWETFLTLRRDDLDLPKKGIVLSLLNLSKDEILTLSNTTHFDISAALSLEIQELSDIQDYLSQILSSNPARFLSKGENSSPQGASSLLRVLKNRRYRDAKKSVMNELYSESSVHRLSRYMLESGPDVLGAFKSEPNLVAGIASMIEVDSWNAHRQIEGPQVPSQALHWMHQLADHDRSDLSVVLALSLIRNSKAEGWRPPDVNIRHLSHVLRLARGATSEDIAGFLQAVATEDWLKVQYGAARTGGLAGALNSLAIHLDASNHGMFLTPALDERLIRSLAGRSPRHAYGWGETLRLIGSYALLGGKSEVYADRTKIDPNVLDQVIEQEILLSDCPDLTHIDVQLLVGLRAVASARAVTVNLPSAAGLLALEKLRSAKPVDPRLVALNLDMIDWLERSERAGWLLVTD